MTSVLIPAQDHPAFLDFPDSPFHRLASLSRQELAATRDIPAAERRLLLPHFIEVFQWSAIQPLLPLQLSVPQHLPTWTARRCRSHYRWLPPDDIHAAADLTGVDDFDLVLRLFDFSPWRSILAQRFKSHLGPPPFDPLSIALAIFLARQRNWSWPQLLQELHSSERGQGYCRRFGFDPADLPRCSTFRMALKQSKELLLQCADSLIQSLQDYGIIPRQSTFPGDSSQRGVSIALDSQLIQARSRMRCGYQNPHCFLPKKQRRCAAQEDGKTGCARDTDECLEHCRRATPRDPEATFVSYASPKPNKTAASPNSASSKAQTNNKDRKKKRGTSCFGYKSKTFNIVDDRLFTFWPIPGPFAPATSNDHLQTIPGFRGLRQRFPGLLIGEVLGDSGEGFDEILCFVYQELKALRLIKPRRNQTDDDPLTLLKRGYDDKGTPLCGHGYYLYANGHDYERQLSTWVCRQRCLRQERPDVLPAAPEEAKGEPVCPYQDSERPLGFTTRVGLAFPKDKLVRLARDFKVGSATWKLRIGRLNYAESQHSGQTRRGNKRSPWHGKSNSAAAQIIGNILTCLTHVARFTREATAEAARRMCTVS